MKLNINFSLQCIFIQALLISGLTSAGSHKKSHSRPKISSTVSNKALKFFILGDFGGQTRKPYTTKTQLSIANAMDSLDSSKHAQFYISTGDNFYGRGVKHAHDKRFKHTFENVYKNPYNKPWYVIAGNHDYYGNITGQLEYAKRNHLWKFPSKFYTVHYDVKDKKEKFTADFVMIDTQRMCGGLPEDRGNWKNEKLKTDKKTADEAFKWTEKVLKGSKANYLFVVGHYPVTSAGFHGPSGCLQKRLLPLLERYNVNAYMCGHDHNLQHITIPHKSGKIHVVLSGAGAKQDTRQNFINKISPAKLEFFYPQPKYHSGKHMKQSHGDKGGFVYTTLHKIHGKFIYYDLHGNRMHDFSIKPRH